MPFAKGLVEVRHSEISGRGLHARVDIPAGTVVWRFQAPVGEEDQWESLTDERENQVFDEAGLKKVGWDDVGAVAPLPWCHCHYLRARAHTYAPPPNTHTRARTPSCTHLAPRRP